MAEFYFLVFLLTSLAGIFISVFTYFRFTAPGNYEISLAFFFTGLSGVFSVFRFIFTRPIQRHFLFSLSLSLIFVAGYFWYRFGVKFTGNSLLTDDLVNLISETATWPTNTHLSYIFLSFVFLGSLTNIFHHLLWTGSIYIPGGQDSSLNKTAIYYLLVSMGYLWYLTGIYYVSRFAKQSNNYLPMIFVSGSVIPMAVSQVYPYVTETYIEDPVMLMALGGFLSILIAFLAIQQLFTVKPIAREKIFTDVESPIVIFDEDLNLKDSNTAYSRLENKEVGLKEILIDEISLTETSETKTIEYANRMYTATVSPIQIFGKSSGYAVILEEITELEKQKQQLKRTNKHFEKFSDSTAHELRNPLTVITGCADYIQSEETDEELQDMARHILEQGSQIESLSADFKTVIEAAQTLEEKQMITVESVINQEFEKQKYNKIDSIKLTMDAEVKAGIFRFPQIFNNLFNFIQVNVEDNEGATIICTVKEDSLYITVTGIGINSSSVEGLLEHGYSTHHNGTGLALSVVETIAEVHGWEAEIEPARDGFTLIFSNLETAKLERKNTELI